MNELIELYKKDRLEVAVFNQKTVDTYVSSVLAYSDFARESSGVTVLNSSGKHLQNWLEFLRPTIGRSRLRQHQYALKSFFTFLYKLDAIENNPAEALQSLQKKPSKKIAAVTSEEVFMLLAAVEQATWYGKRDHLIVAILWCLGLRVSELTSLKVKSFEADVENGIGLLRVRGKNKKQRALFVVDALYDEICAYLEDPRSPQRNDAPLFPGQNTTALSSNRIRKRIKEYVDKAGITSTITPHILRHTFATEMYIQGVPFSAIQAMLGHEKNEETALYIHVPLHMQKDALGILTLSGGAAWQ
jgi:integrase/recombinase XerD